MGERFRKFAERYRRARVITDAVGIAPPFEEKEAAFREYYSVNQQVLRAAEKTIRNLVQLLLSDVGMEEPKVDSRLKDRNECIRKFKLKYLDEVERRGEDYELQDYITDLLGIRVVCLYESDIELVERTIADNFEILAITNKTKSLIDQVDAFGYKGLHLDVRLDQERRKFPEYKKFGDLRFEVQIRSIVQDAWSEVDHKLKYKKQIPDVLKRRIVRLAALFELADQEFDSIRAETCRLVESATATSTDDLPGDDAQLDSFAFLSIMTSMYPTYNFDPVKIDGFVDEIKQFKPDLTVQEVLSAIANNAPLVSRYRHFKESVDFNFNPFTEIRHILYLMSPNIMDRVLYPRQRDAFLNWMSQNPGEDESNAAE